MAPERLAAFESALAGGGAWRCVPPGGRVEATLPAASLNDDYCDCNDGSDEPGTSACAGSGGGGGGEAGGFHCASGLALGGGAHVAASRVDDGVCDCCDGSDERDGACADRCTEMRKGERERDAGRRRGAARKATYETMAIEQPALLKVGAVELRAMLTTCHLPPTTYHLPPTTYHLPLTTYYLPLTTYYLLLTTCYRWGQSTSERCRPSELWAVSASRANRASTSTKCAPSGVRAKRSAAEADHSR